MTESSLNLDDRDAALAAFTQARDGFESAYRLVPDEALRYVPEGEDYTLGGLLVHVTDTIQGYTQALDQMVAAGFGSVRTVESDDEVKREHDALVRDGFAGSDRGRVIAELRGAHEAFTTKVQALPLADYTRVAPVLFGAEATDPYDTRAADILGWLIDHYNEHIEQVASLLERWKTTRS
jgi:hypothetical protein